MTQIAANIAALLNKVSELEKQVGESTGEKTMAEQIDALTKQVEELETKIGGSSNPELNTLTTALAKALRSLVYIPSLYVDGIETIVYPYLTYTPLTLSDNKQMTRKRATAYTIFDEDYVKTIVNAADSKFPKLAELKDYYEKTNTAAKFFAPVWPVEYHMNPSRSTTAWEDVLGFNVREAEVITRSEGGKTIKAVEKYTDDTPVFANKNGILTVGLQIPGVNQLANHITPTEATGRPGTIYESGVDSHKNQFDDIIALQVKSGEDTIITSDYAMVYPEKAYVEGIIWTKHHSKLGYNKVDYDETGANCGKMLHVWDTPDEALGAVDPSVYPDIELNYKDTEGIVLQNLLGVHLYHESKRTGISNPKDIAFTSPELARWGLSYEFQLVGYSIDGNSTIDSNYAEFTDANEKGVSNTGTIRARNVKEDGTTIDTQSATSVGREPLVRVLVKHDSDVVYDGYILIHITQDKPTPVEDQSLIVDNYPNGGAKFNLCDGATILSTNWSQFSYLVLTEKLNNMTKENFDATYGIDYDGVPDLNSDAQEKLADNSTRYDDVKIFNDNNGKPGSEATVADMPGHVKYFHNSIGTTNHRFEWVITAEEFEKYTHDNTLPVTVTKWFRYTGKAGAEYKYIYVKMTADLSRETLATTGITEKNKEYWFSANSATLGADDGFDAIFMNAQFPADGGSSFQAPAIFNNDIINTFAGPNKVNFTNSGFNGFSAYNNLSNNSVDRNKKAKFYIVPRETTIKSQAGVTYHITPRSGYSDTKWNKYICKYIDSDSHVWSANAADNKAVFEKCAIAYDKGMFTNDALYAYVNVTEPQYTKIADLTQEITSGHMELVFRTPDDDTTKEILNAIGYEENHANVLKEFHAMIGVVAKNDCDVAIYVNEYVDDADNKEAGQFWASWQRPINVDTNSKDMVDAKDNGDFIYLVDMLKMFDWRGPVAGKMYDEGQWLWAYYNVKSVTINVNAADVMTTMNQPEGQWKELSKVSTKVILRCLAPDGTANQSQLTINIADGLTNAYPTYYNEAAKSAELKADMGIYPENDINKAKFGGIYYENNGENVEDFDLLIPVQVNYGWGRFIAKVTVHIHRSLGN
jgi:hypothetical protein